MRNYFLKFESNWFYYYSYYCYKAKKEPSILNITVAAGIDWIWISCNLLPKQCFKTCWIPVPPFKSLCPVKSNITKFLIPHKIKKKKVKKQEIGSVSKKLPSTEDQHTIEGTLSDNLFSDRSWPHLILQTRVQQSSPPENKHTNKNLTHIIRACTLVKPT